MNPIKISPNNPIQASASYDSFQHFNSKLLAPVASNTGMSDVIDSWIETEPFPAPVDMFVNQFSQIGNVSVGLMLIFLVKNCFHFSPQS
jgi:hypothetical protein